jgi:hypothetical protein
MKGNQLSTGNAVDLRGDTDKKAAVSEGVFEGM